MKYYVDAITFLPHPGDTSKTYIIQQAIDSTYTICPIIPLASALLQLRYSIIDNNANNGQGAIISKHNVLLNAAFNMGILTIKHGNGRDWWIIVKRFNTNLFQRFLLTPNGITGPTAQYYDTARCSDYWSWRYSTLTQKVVGFRGDGVYPTTRYMDVFDFDRCTGLFSNQQLITINNYLPLPYSGACEISPNGRFLYAGVLDELHQFDLTAPNIQASAVVVDTLDSINFWSLHKSWFLMQAAPDGKIYGVSFFGDTFLNVIHYPDSAGLACMAVAKSISLPNNPNFALPHTPLYELGPLPG
ncbi:MAG: hypothetical protein JNK61_10015, partial [Bacteroidia bacterium]|nr:hypothetical protein [Bacteroidia bacterium]